MAIGDDWMQIELIGAYRWNGQEDGDCMEIK
jgi:hypothetical protein